jgi:chromatin segregation and condensation protein Rec8/ScpA/Scc1 (kleisin family)
MIRRDRGLGTPKKTVTKLREAPQPASPSQRAAPQPPGDRKGKRRAQEVRDWDTVLREAKASDSQQNAQTAAFEDDLREKQRRIAEKMKERTQSRRESLETKGKGKESDGNDGMSI